MTYYPGNAIRFNYRTNVRDTVVASDVNVIYDEVIAIGGTLGVNPQTSATWGSLAFDGSTTSWGSVAARLQNIENGLHIATTSYVRLAGGSTINPSDNSVVGVVLKGRSAGTDLLQAQASGSTTAVTKINRDGVLYHGGYVVSTLNGTETLSNKTLTSTTIDGSVNTLSKIPATAVIAQGTTNIKTYVDYKPDVYYQSSDPTAPKQGDIWVNTSSSITPFDSSNFIQYSAPSLTTQNGSMGAGTAGGWHRIIASTSAPTGTDGANGDVWLQFI